MKRKKSQYKHALIANKRYYFYSIRWVDIMGDSSMPPKTSSTKWNPLSLLLMPICSKETISMCTPLRVLMRMKRSSQTETSSQKDASSR